MYAIEQVFYKYVLLQISLHAIVLIWQWPLLSWTQSKYVHT